MKKFFLVLAVAAMSFSTAFAQQTAAAAEQVEAAVEQVEGIEIGAKVTVVDAGKCRMYMRNFGEFFNNQVENADIIVMSRTDTAKDNTARMCLGCNNLCHNKTSPFSIISL